MSLCFILRDYKFCDFEVWVIKFFLYKKLLVFFLVLFFEENFKIMNIWILVVKLFNGLKYNLIFLIIYIFLFVVNDFVFFIL